MDVNVIVCDECKAEFDPKGIQFKTANTTIEDTKLEVVYYTCSKCGKAYVVCLLDYWGKKLQNKYVEAMDKYRAAYKSGNSNPVKLQQKMEKVEKLKEDAMSYQNELLHKYGELLPEEIFV